MCKIETEYIFCTLFQVCGNVGKRSCVDHPRLACLPFQVRDLAPDLLLKMRKQRVVNVVACLVLSLQFTVLCYSIQRAGIKCVVGSKIWCGQAAKRQCRDASQKGRRDGSRSLGNWRRTSRKTDSRACRKGPEKASPVPR